MQYDHGLDSAQVSQFLQCDPPALTRLTISLKGCLFFAKGLKGPIAMPILCRSCLEFQNVTTLLQYHPLALIWLDGPAHELVDFDEGLRA
jgi:hypothetical protein